MLKSGSEDNKALSYSFLAVLQNFWLRFEATILFKIVSKSNSYATGDDVIPHSPWDKSPKLMFCIKVKLLENIRAGWQSQRKYTMSRVVCKMTQEKISGERLMVFSWNFEDTLKNVFSEGYICNI